MTAKARLARRRRHRRVRMKISGTSERPRLNVYRSSKHIYAQVIDDTEGITMVAASTVDKEILPLVGGKQKKEQAVIVGKIVAERAMAAGISTVVFDRGGYQYHGRVEALAKSAREGGLKF
ncbi:MAG TPA: 50S ribosomal protein L18 [candidate division Zixibacteria bacterium]|nr:50S ribosomal protein L18 [candidate division Zixibacteria bacterium]